MGFNDKPLATWYTMVINYSDINRDLLVNKDEIFADVGEDCDWEKATFHTFDPTHNRCVEVPSSDIPDNVKSYIFESIYFTENKKDSFSQKCSTYKECVIGRIQRECGMMSSASADQGGQDKE